MSSENWAWGKGLIKKMTLIGLSLYGLIMLSLILIYKESTDHHHLYDNYDGHGRTVYGSCLA